jgi:uncharacterized protein
MTEHSHQGHDHDHSHEEHHHDHSHEEHHHEHSHEGHEHSHEGHGHDHSHEGHDHSHGHVHEPVDEGEELAGFRAAKDEFFREDPRSPIPEARRDSFEGLSYFPFNPALHLHATLDRNVPDEVVTMDTSTGQAREYRRAGKIHFEVDEQPAELTVFEGSQGELFVPMRDATSGKETYGAGRYLEPEMVDDETVHVDFNLLYNPYCAYNEAYSCPLPPVENWLRVPIEAGEKNFH